MSPVRRVTGKDDAVLMGGSQHEYARQWQGDARFLGVGDRGMSDIVIMRQPGRPCVFFWKGVCRTTEEGERQMRRRESDGPIVLLIAGNAAVGKGATHGSVV